MKSDLAVISQTALSRFSDIAFSNKHRIRRAWLISPWIAYSTEKRDPLSYLTEALHKCPQTWLITRPPKLVWHENAIKILRANSSPRPTVLFNEHLHAKLYLLDCDGFRYALLGSPNFTPRADTQNRELAIEFTTTASPRADKISAVIQELVSYAELLLVDPKTELQS